MKNFWVRFLKRYKDKPIQELPTFDEERAWSYLTSSYINMGLNPFQPNPHGLCCLLSVFSSENLTSGKLYIEEKSLANILF